MKIVVTGGVGFIGRHVFDELRAAGHDVLVLDRAAFHPVELTRARLEPHLEHAAAVVHCAAYADISRNWESKAERDKLWRDNLLALLAVLEAMAPSARLVFCSTAALERGTESPYAASKAAGEALCNAYGQWRETYAARLVSCVGPGYRHGHVADFLAQEAAGRVVRPLDAGTQRKTFVHVKDAARALAMMALGRVAPGTHVVASAERWSCRDSARALELGELAWPAHTGGWVGDPIDLDVRASEALEAAGWKPERSVESGVREAARELRALHALPRRIEATP